MCRALPFLIMLTVSATARAAADGDCPSWGDPVEIGPLPQGLQELSGLAASPGGGLIWALNDSGGTDVLAALDSEGASLGEVGVRGADNADWEDLAAGPCAEEGCSCLIIGDLGDQEGARKAATLYRVYEPEADLPRSTEEAEVITLSWPDGSYDAEALAVHPQTGEVVLVPKVDGPVGVYVGSLEGGELSRAAELDLAALGADDPRVTGAAASPGGLRLAIRTESQIFVWNTGGGALIDALAGEPEVIDAPDDEGEAVSFSADGQSLYVAGEGGGSLWEIPCAVWADEVSVDAAAPCPTGCGCAASPARATTAGLVLGLLALLRRRRYR